MTDTDQEIMEQALGLALQAEAKGEVPVGALVVLAGEVVGRGCNEPIGTTDPTAHAEIQALRSAAATVGNYRLPGATLFVTMEPCVMCAGAMVHARIERLVFGCSDLRAGAAGTVFDLTSAPQLNHVIAVTPGVLEHECRAVLQAFFKARR